MAPKIFLTGATGYIGGSVFHTLYTAHPDWSYTVLLRTVPPTFSDLYPAANIIRGDYDSLDAPSTAAAISDADVVVHTGNSDHAPSLRALLRGLKKDDGSTSKTTMKLKTKYLIHLSGTGILSDYQSSSASSPSSAGTLNPRIYSDVSLADNTDVFLPPADDTDWKEPLHGETERIVYEAWRREEDAKEQERETGYYHATTQETSQLELAQAVGRILYEKGLVGKKEPVQVPLERVDGMMSALGAKAVLGWEPKAPSIWDILEQDVTDAVETLGSK
ncbi:hypothetical protein SLS55_004833 [Diplodia seriata]|uniref:NAD(P)-binding domain-containing protein n=1 Tax=Diplodia seriata TaxID=420778 RepID=A0ABR3CKG6_9PEZI